MFVDKSLVSIHIYITASVLYYSKMSQHLVLQAVRMCAWLESLIMCIVHG